VLALTALGVSRFAFGLEIPSLAGAAVAALLLLLAGLILVLGMAVLFVLQSRERYSFLPLRDYRHYLLPERRLHG
jgi:hypothetical protein